MAESMASDLNDFVQARFELVFENLLGVIQRQLDLCIEPTDVPPIIAARIEHNSL
jgi:hypothetical protein